MPYFFILEYILKKKRVIEKPITKYLVTLITEIILG